MTPYWSDDAITLYHGDCREVLARLGLNFHASLTIADPPYGDTSLAWDRWPSGWVAAVAHVSPQMWCFGSMRMWLANGGEFDMAGWQFAQDVIWRKHNGSSFLTGRFRRVHEHVLHWYRGNWSALTLNDQFTNDATARTVRRKTRPAHLGKIDDSTYTSIDGGPRMMTSVIECRSMHGKAIHPTEKPLRVLEPLIRFSTNPGDLIFDPMAGSCSTARAARATGRRAVCIEADERYLERAVHALESRLAL